VCVGAVWPLDSITSCIPSSKLLEKNVIGEAYECIPEY
jgi:hypothetical protein